MCIVLSIATSGCASTNIPITSPESSGVASNVSIKKGDYVLINTNDDRKVNMVVTEINSKRKILIGRPISQPEGSYYEPIAVYYSDIVGIEIKQHIPPEKNMDSITFWEAIKLGFLQIFLYL